MTVSLGNHIGDEEKFLFVEVQLIQCNTYKINGSGKQSSMAVNTEENTEKIRYNIPPLNKYTKHL